MVNGVYKANDPRYRSVTRCEMVVVPKTTRLDPLQRWIREALGGTTQGLRCCQ